MIKLLCWCPECGHHWTHRVWAWESNPLTCEVCHSASASGFGPLWTPYGGTFKQIVFAHCDAVARIAWRLSRTVLLKSPGNSA